MAGMWLITMNNYQSQVETLSSTLQALKGKSRLFVILELVSFLAAVALFVVYCAIGFHLPWLLGAVLALSGYIAVRHYDLLNDKAVRAVTKRRIVYERELRYLDGDFTPFDDGRRYADPRHAFTFDMDLFGRDSLFNRMNRTVTTGGSDALARMLGTLPSSAGEVSLKRDAVNELALNEAWRTEFLARGQRLTPDGKESREKICSEAIISVIREVNGMNLPRHFTGKASLAVAAIAIAGFFMTVALAVLTPLPPAVPVMWAVLQLFVVLTLTARPLRNIMTAVGTLHTQMQSYISLIRHIHNAEYESLELKRLRSELFGGGDDALESFNRLSDILGRLDRRANVLGLIAFNILFLSDFFLVRRFLRWQGMYMERMPQWVEAVSRLDAYASMAVLRYNHPEAVAAVVEDCGCVVYDAHGLYHPFLGAKAVRNDFTVKDSNYYIITGANMAGKSTFLRAVGINYILAMNGMPVFADSLSVSVYNLFSSMRTTDDLSHGISYFNAELLRLRQLIESCKQHAHTLIILDEILKGTNSLDKLNGSRLFLKEISRLPVSGIIATHDLELSRLAEEHPMRFHNYCFEIELGGEITYTYKITPGVARNQNATYLLKQILREI